MTPADLKVSHHFVDLALLRMHYVEVGPSSGPLVVLLHGFPENWWSWRYQLEPLANAGFRVVAPDLRGYGDTQKHGPYDIDTLTTDVCRFIEALGARKARIVGHDWGGAVAWHLAAKRPDFCERLAVLNCPHPAVMRQALINKPSLEQLKRSWYFFFFLLPGLPEWLLTRNDGANTARTIKSASIDRTHFLDDELQPFREGIQKPGAASAMVGWYRDIVKSGLRNPFSPPAYDDITADTLLIWGMDDPALGYADLVPGTEKFVSKLTIKQIPGCGHFVHAERPDLVTPALIEFLR
ncbi:MAG: alpha/beta fold hydrolase [Myxococcota bacterium]